MLKAVKKKEVSFDKRKFKKVTSAFKEFLEDILEKDYNKYATIFCARVLREIKNNTELLDEL